MAHFRIFIPDLATANVDHLNKVGLGHLIPGAVMLGRAVGQSCGQLVTWNGEDPSCDTEEFDWIPAIEAGDLKAGRYLVGLKQGERPEPEELAWPRRFAGYKIQLGDGKTWVIPAAGMLPASMKKIGDGRTTFEVKREFAAFFEESKQWFAEFVMRDFTQHEQVFDCSVFDYLARALRMNYRLTDEVISELELFGPENLAECLQATVDGISITEELLEFQKKKMEDELPAG